ncbi:MAG: alpha/beta fold hydrolase [Acidimicrobiales bacterium]
MSTYVLIHGAGSDSWYWHVIVPELRASGHDVVAVDLPCDDDRAGLAEYTETVVEAAGDASALILVAQSLAGFTAPLVCERISTKLIVMVNAMIPRPDESPGEWWVNTGHVFPDPFDPEEVFTHDLPPALKSESLQHVREQSGTPFERPWPLDAWPDVPTRVLVSRHDRFFSAEFQRRIARERLGIVPDEIDGGHLPALARPLELARRLELYGSDA